MEAKIDTPIQSTYEEVAHEQPTKKGKGKGKGKMVDEFDESVKDFEVMKVVVKDFNIISKKPGK